MLSVVWLTREQLFQFTIHAIFGIEYTKVLSISSRIAYTGDSEATLHEFVYLNKKGGTCQNIHTKHNEHMASHYAETVATSASCTTLAISSHFIGCSTTVLGMMWLERNAKQFSHFEDIVRTKASSNLTNSSQKKKKIFLRIYERSSPSPLRYVMVS